jgi:hypothetical protein
MSAVYKIFEIPLRSISYLFESLQSTPAKKPTVELYDDLESPQTQVSVEPIDATKMNVYNMRPRKPITYKV